MIRDCHDFACRLPWAKIVTMQLLIKVLLLSNATPRLVAAWYSIHPREMVLAWTAIVELCDFCRMT